MSYRDDFREVEGQAFWTLPRAVFGMLALLVVFYGIGFIATGGDLAIYRFWAPKMANAQRVVFENTQSYVEGKTEYLNQLRLAYSNADGGQKEMLRQTILTEASTVDNEKLPVDLQLFVRSLR
jgi:hypothetical protein